MDDRSSVDKGAVDWKMPQFCIIKNLGWKTKYWEQKTFHNIHPIVCFSMTDFLMSSWDIFSLFFNVVLRYVFFIF